MVLGDRIKISPIRGLRDLIWTETSLLVEDDLWFDIRHSISNPITILVVDSKTLLRLLWN